MAITLLESPVQQILNSELTSAKIRSAQAETGYLATQNAMIQKQLAHYDEMVALDQQSKLAGIEHERAQTHFVNTQQVTAEALRGPELEHLLAQTQQSRSGTEANDAQRQGAMANLVEKHSEMVARTLDPDFTPADLLTATQHAMAAAGVKDQTPATTSLWAEGIGSQFKEIQEKRDQQRLENDQNQEKLDILRESTAARPNVQLPLTVQKGIAQIESQVRFLEGQKARSEKLIDDLQYGGTIEAPPGALGDKTRESASKVIDQHRKGIEKLDARIMELRNRQIELTFGAGGAPASTQPAATPAPAHDSTGREAVMQDVIDEHPDWPFEQVKAEVNRRLQIGG